MLTLTADQFGEQSGVGSGGASASGSPPTLITSWVGCILSHALSLWLQDGCRQFPGLHRPPSP